MRTILRGLAILAGLAPALAGAQGITIDSPYDAVSLANDAFVDERYRDAADLYEIALVGLPDSPVLHFNQGNAYFKLNELSRAIPEYMRALETDSTPFAAKVHYNLGNAYYQGAINAMRTFRDAVTPIRKAMQSYRDALALDSDLVDAMYNLELADRLFEELLAQRVQPQPNPFARDQETSANRGQVMNAQNEGERDSETLDEADEGMDNTGEQGEQALDGMQSEDDRAEAASESSQREMSAEEAQDMVELVRDKARAAEALRQQWRQARMREAGIARPW